jgi:CPA2 family monovalent cation:H+ antiporter-2
MFAAIFFVTVGMLVEPRVLMESPGLVVAFTLLVLAGKLVGVTLGGFLSGFGLRTAVQAGMTLAQIGEFSFVIAGVGLATNAAPAALYQVAVAVCDHRAFTRSDARRPTLGSHHRACRRSRPW